MSQVWRLRELLQGGAVLAWAAVAAMSLTPGQDRTSTGVLTNVGYCIAYCAAAAVTRAALPHVQSRWQIIAFSIAAGWFETCQIWIPGRPASVVTWLASTVGAALGVIMVRTVLHEHLLRLL